MHPIERLTSVAHRAFGLALVVAALSLAAAGARAQASAVQPSTAPPAPSGPSTYYQCPGNVFTNTITAKEAEARKCTAREAKEPTTIPAPTRVRAPAPAAVVTPGPASARIDPAAQRARDSDARQILETELKTEEARLAALQKEFNNGEPERQGNERNFQKYLDRVAEMRAAISRKESDIAAIKRELTKLPSR